MIDPERLAAFTLMTAATSIVPGVSMLFAMGEAVRAGWRSGAMALAGMQLGYLVWWLLAALGLGTLAAAFPAAFKALAIAGGLYLAWLGIQAIRHASDPPPGEGESRPRSSRHAFASGVFVALGNPKSLIYMVALIPPFVDAHAPVAPQLAVLAVVALVIDVAVGAVYIGAGRGLTSAMARPVTRTCVNRAIGAIYLLIAAGVLIDLAGR